MTKRYEFWCRSCGAHYYLETASMANCEKPDCLEVLELAATVEINENIEGVLGMHDVVSSRQTIDKRRR